MFSFDSTKYPSLTETANICFYKVEISLGLLYLLKARLYCFPNFCFKIRVFGEVYYSGWWNEILIFFNLHLYNIILTVLLTSQEESKSAKTDISNRL